jgi:hypothetical protein
MQKCLDQTPYVLALTLNRIGREVRAFNFR